MARIFITGSADGLGQLAARSLTEQGHEVLLHARDERRGKDALAVVPSAMGVVTADLSSIDETKKLADKVNEHGTFTAVIHNAAVYQAPGELIFSVNILAPYILTCLIHRPERLIYMSSGMHRGGQVNLENFKGSTSEITYSDSKLYMLMLANAVARRWPEVYSNAIDPGWVPTKMGGANAPDDLEEGYETQIWLAVSDEPGAKVSGRYLHHKREDEHNPEGDGVETQDRFIRLCEEITGVSLPE